MNRESGKQIEKAISAAHWEEARRNIRAQLKRKPDNHWLLTRLSLTYYEQKQYRRALHYSVKALQHAPYCPLAIWDYAGTLNMLGRNGEALALYRWLISWGEDYLAYGECGEGLPAARSMIGDCYFRIAGILDDQRQLKRALKALDKYFSLRKRGVRSIYTMREAKGHYRRIQLAVLERKSRAAISKPAKRP
jgi:predicted Zn-dependent protease